MRNRTLGRIISLLFWTAFAVGLLFLSLSSFALKNLWLPLAAHSFGYALTVESAAFSPFRQGPNLTIRGMNVRSTGGNEAHLDFCEAKVRPLSLLAGIVDMDAVRLNGVRLKISREAELSGFDTSLKSRNLKIGAMDFSDIRIFLPLPDGSTGEIRAASASVSGLIPETDNTLKGTFRLYPGGVSADAPGIDLRTELRFSLDRHFRPASLLGSLTLSNGSGLWHDRSLNGTDGILLVKAEAKSPGGPLQWKANLDLSGVDCTELIHAEGRGSADQDGASGTMNWTASVRFSDARIQERLLPDSPDLFISPDNLRLKDGAFALEWDPQSVHWTLDGEIALDRLWVRKTESVSNGSFRFHQDMKYSRGTKELTLQKLRGELQMGEASLSCRNEGLFIFSRDDSGYHVRDTNASLLLNVRSLPADLLNPFIPVNISGGCLSLDYRLTADSRLQELTGGMTAFLKDIAFSENGEEIVRKHNMAANLSFHSRGLENIRGLIVDECSGEITASESGQKILRADLSGTWDPRDGGLTLSGRMDLNPYTAVGLFVRSPAEDLREILRRHDAENVWYHCSLNTDFDPARSSDLSFGIKTSFDTLAFLESGIKTPLVLDIEGKISRDQDGSGSGVDLHTIRLDASELAAISAQGHLSLSNEPSNFQVEIERISPVIPRGLMRFFYRNDLTEEQISLFRFKSLSGEASFRFDPADLSLRVFPFRAVMIPADDPRSAVTLTLDRDFLCFLPEPEKNEAAMSLVVENLPVKWFDFLLPTDAAFRFLSGMVQGSAEVTVRNNGADIFLDHDAIVEEFSFAVKNAVWDAGDCRTSGKSCFRDLFTSYDLTKVQLRCMDGPQEYLLLETDGSLALTPEGLTFFNIDIRKTSELLPSKVFGNISRHLAVRTFDAAGKARFDGNEDYSRNRFTGRVDIHSLEWEPDEETGLSLEPLTGTAEIDLAEEPFLLRFRKSGINLADGTGHRIFHLGADGDFSSDLEQTGPVQCRISSKGVDGEFLYRIFTRKTGVPSSPAAEDVPAPPEVKTRPAAVPVTPVSPVPSVRTEAKVPATNPAVRPEEKSETAAAVQPRENGNGTPDPAAAETVKPVLPRGDESTAVWPFRGEPPAFRIYGYKTELAMDLRELTFTKYVKGSLSGTFSASDDTLEAKDVLLRINESESRCSGKVLTAGENGLEYQGRLSLSGLDVSGLILAGAELKGKDFPISELRGVIRDLNLEVEGRGLSLKHLDRFLKVRLNADMEQLSIPLDAGTAAVLFRLLLLPIQQIPRLVKILPPSPLRRNLLRMTGEGGAATLGGLRKAEFTKGVLELESAGTDILVKRLYFTGPEIKTRVVRGGFNPFYNVVRMDLMTSLSGINLPLRFVGRLDEPDIDKTYFLMEFFKRNTSAAGENTLNVLSLGLTGKDDDAVWTAPAESLKPAEPGGLKPGGPAPGSR